MKYDAVNASWPANTREGRDLKPTPAEAKAAARLLYNRFAKDGKKWTGPIKARNVRLTSGRNHTYSRDWRQQTLNVNPDQRGGGWHELVHSLSHHVEYVLYGEQGHGSRHAFIEAEMVRHVVASGWLDGKLKRPERSPAPPTDKRAAKLANVRDRLKRWETKAKRAATAIRKLRAAERRLTK